MVLKKVVSTESKGQPGAAPAAAPLLSSQSADLYCLFRVSPPLRHKIARGGGYIVSFNFTWRPRLQLLDSQGRWAPPCGSGSWSRGESFFPPHGVPRLFFFSRSLISRKNDVVKRLGPFDVQKVPKSQKQENLFRNVKTKLKGII
jgi:hypothetical protein